MRAALPLLALMAAAVALAARPLSDPPLSIAGMTLEIRDDRLIVAAIRPGSPAAAAGLLTGDALLVVNDANLIDLDPLSAEEVLALLRKGGAEEVRLVVGRGAGTLGVALPRRDAAAPAAARREPPAAGSEAPDFSARTLKGETLRLRDLRGRPVLLDFWAAWCAPCRDAAIPLRRLAGEYADRLAIVGVSLDSDPKAFEAFAYNNHLPGHQILDGGWYGPVSSLYGIPATGIPFAVLLDARGRVVSASTGMEDAEKEIVRLLGPATKS